MVFNPTIQQQAIFDFIQNGQGNAVIDAVAGSGKTTTVVEALKYIPPNKRILFLAFNTHIVDHLRTKVPKHVEVATTHSKGRSLLVEHGFIEPQNKVEGLKNHKIFDKVFSTYTYQGTPLNEFIGKRSSNTIKKSVISIIDKAKNNLVKLDADFAKNIEYIIDYYSIEIPDIVSKSDSLENETYLTITQFNKIISDVYRQSALQKSIITFDDMIFFPALFGLKPKRGYDYVIVDEAQDLNKCQAEITKNLLNPNGRIIVVGDPFQCFTEGSEIETPSGITKITHENYKNLRYTTSCGGDNTLKRGIITDVYEKYVENKTMVKITTKIGKVLTVTPEHMLFADLEKPKGKINMIYLMYREDKGYRVGTLTVLSKDLSIKEGTIRIKSRRGQESADKMWILKIVDSNSEAMAWEQIISVNYGIPTTCFNKHGSSIDEHIDLIFSNVDSRKNVKKLMDDFLIYENYPHHVPKCTLRDRRNFVVTLLGEIRGLTPKSNHRFAISGDDENDRKILKDLNFSTRPAKKGVKGWRFESVTSDLSKIETIINTIKSKMEINVITKAKILKDEAPYLMVPASHVKKHMRIPIYHNNVLIEDIVENVEIVKYTGYIYDVNVEQLHNYIVNGIVSHNSIYGFRAADVDSIKNLKKDFNAIDLPLTVTFRCPLSHVKFAQQFVPHIQARPDAPEGEIRDINVNQIVDLAEPGDLILCRNNAPLVSVCLKFIKQGIKANIKGADLGKALVSLIKDLNASSINALQTELKKWKIDEVRKCEEFNQNPQTVMDKYECIIELISYSDAKSVNSLIAYINDIFTEEVGEITLSSVHKAKGLESDTVFILYPNLMPCQYATKDWEITQEENIQYVAYTRSKSVMYFVYKGE